MGEKNTAMQSKLRNAMKKLNRIRSNDLKKEQNELRMNRERTAMELMGGLGDGNQYTVQYDLLRREGMRARVAWRLRSDGGGGGGCGVVFCGKTQLSCTLGRCFVVARSSWRTKQWLDRENYWLETR